MKEDKKKKRVSILRYEKANESVRKAVDLSRGLENLPNKAKVFIKPNIVFWTKSVPFPKWGVITTSRVIEDVILLLKERGIEDITIGEGMVLLDAKDRETPAHAFESLGYQVLKRRYGVKYINIHERPFEKVTVCEELDVRINSDIMKSDFVINIPVLKAHAQTLVSLAIKNIKGVLDIASRQKCHSPDPVKDLNYIIAKLYKIVPQGLTIIDGIYSLERGPGFDGKARRSNILIVSGDILSADMVGAKVMGFDPADVPYLKMAAEDAGRKTDLTDIEVVGEKIEAVASRYGYSFPYTKEGTLPLLMKRIGIKGLSYRQYDLTMCTYCSILNAPILAGLAMAWQGEPWDDVEVLTGKVMKATPGKKKTILIGNCIYQANKNNPGIREMIAVKGCPPSAKGIIAAFHKAGIKIDPAALDRLDTIPGMFMQKYENRPEFDEAFFRVE